MAVAVKSTPLVCAGHTRPVPSLHFSPLLAPSSPVSPESTSTDPDYILISSCKDGKPQLRNWLGDWLGTFVGHKGAVWSARLSPLDGSLAVTGSADFTAKVWDAHSGECLTTLPHQHIVRTVDLSSSGTHVLTGGHEKKLRVWDLSRCPKDGTDAQPNESDGTVVEFKSEGGKTAHQGTIKSACWDEKRNSIISMAEDGKIKWWDTKTRQQIHEIQFEEPITSMEKSYDGETLAITSGNKVIFLSLSSRSAERTHTLNYTPSTASLHPIHRNLFVTGSVRDEWVRVHDAETGEEKQVGKGHHGPVHCVSFSPDGEMYASGSEDGTIRLWQTEPRTYGLWRYNEQ